MGATMSDHFCDVCEVCGEDIDSGDRIIRVAAEACTSDAMMAKESLVFGTFHAACIVETFRDETCDGVPYIEEARETLMASSLCDCCIDKVAPVEKLSLKLIRGGLS